MKLQPPARLLPLADRTRRLVWKAFGPRTIGIRGLIVDGERRVLLVRHTYGPRQWHLPGGGVKRRESLVEALHRELREEVGVIVDGDVRLHGVFSNLSEGKSDHISVFVVEHWRRADSDSTEIDSARFFPSDDLPDEVSRGTARRIGEWLRDEPTGFIW